MTKKRKHVSKKSKSSWRKNTDIQDVENFLDDQRLEERLGIRFADQPDSELFVIDTEPQVSKEKLSENLEGLSSKQRRRLLLQEVPRCFQSLVNTSKVSLPSGTRKNTKPEVNPITEQKKIAKGVYKKKLDMAKINRKLDRERKENKKDLRSKISMDLWEENRDLLKLSQPTSEWFTLDTKNINKARITPAKPKTKPFKNKSIVLPDPGTSYNPTFKDHQELIQKVIAKEMDVIKEETHLNRVTSGMFRKVSVQQKLKEDLEELRQGLPNNEEIQEEDDGEYKPINPPVVNKKKTRKVKTHIRQDKLIRSEKLAQLAEKKKLGGVYKLRFIQNAIEKNHEKNEKIRERRKIKKKENPSLPRINSKFYEEPPPVFADVKELSGNLRSLVPKGGGLTEHFTSLQRRGIAPVSVPLKLKKPKQKRYTLSSHKMPWEITEGFAKPSKRNKEIKS